MAEGEHEDEDTPCFNCGKLPKMGDMHTACECGERITSGRMCNRYVCDDCRFTQGVFAWPPNASGLERLAAGATYDDLEWDDILEVAMECYEVMQKEDHAANNPQ